MAFTPNALGTQGNSKRRDFYGPGIDNFDMAQQDDESRRGALVGASFGNVQCLQPRTVLWWQLAVDGNIGNQGSTFGFVTKAADPRIGQIAAKFRF